MKKLVRALICLSISLVALNCSNDESMPVHGKVQFALSVSTSSTNGGRIASQSFPAGAYIALSIETTSGSPVYTLEHIELIQLGNGYLTAPLDLTEGSYHLTDFLVMSAGGDVLYATPKEGSPLAGLVDDPLPMNFSVTQNEIANLNIQVVDVDQQSPQDFGYVSFGVEVVGSDFAVSLFATDGDELSLTSGKLELYQGDDLVYEQSLDAKVNTVNFKGDLNGTYKLVVIKEGYTIRTREYVLHDLIDELDGKPLVMVLSPAIVITLKVTYPSQIWFFIRTETEEITVDWGDGVIEPSTLFSGFYMAPAHMYENVGTYYINITGDLLAIKGFSLDGQGVDNKQSLELIDITQLSELTFFGLRSYTAPEQINFAHNSKLEALQVVFTSVRSLDVSNMPMLKNIDISNNALPGYNVVEIISHVYNHAISNSINEGTFTYVNKVIDEDSRIKLIYLRDHYGWFIRPDLQ